MKLLGLGPTIETIDYYYNAYNRVLSKLSNSITNVTVTNEYKQTGVNKQF